MTGATILVVDDEAGIREQLVAILGDEGYRVLTAATGEQALAMLGREAVDLVLLDLWLPGVDGIEVLRRTRANGNRVPVVVISGHAGGEQAVRAVREGAVDFLEKPLALERVLISVRNALVQARLEDRLRALPSDETPVLTGCSAAVQELRRQIMQAAPSDARVLITGPNGAGKELVARLLHAYSARSAGPFVALNCAAIPSELIESELFGHVRGAFTGAAEARRGRFELADGGTLLLDEVGDMSPLTQAKVLRVLETSRFERLGGSSELTVDVRVIAATNKNLTEEMAAGRFRDDLFYRLNVIPLRVPSLAQRREDIPALAEELMAQASRRFGLAPKRFSPEAIAALQRHPWPGNVRELRNLVERVAIMVEADEVGPDRLDLLQTGEGGWPWRGELLPLREARGRFERAYLEQALREAGGNMSQAARLLGLERSNLYRKLRALGIRVR